MIKTHEAAWVAIAKFYQRNLEDMVIKMYADTSKSFGMTVEDLVQAFELYRNNPKNERFPLPATLAKEVNMVDDPDEEARLLANRINIAVRRYGHTNGPEAREFIGEIGWKAVEQYGWYDLCIRLGSSMDIGTFLSQARETVKPMIREKRSREAALRLEESKRKMIE